MFQMEIENPFDERIQFINEEPLFDFKMIQLKYKIYFYTYEEMERDRMLIEKLDIEPEHWMENYLTMENGLIEFTVPKTGTYHIMQQSRSSSAYDPDVGPAMGVTVQFEWNLKKVINIKITKLFSHVN